MALYTCLPACALDNSMSKMEGTAMVVNNTTIAPLLNRRKRVSEQLDDFSPTQMEAIEKAIMRIAATTKVGNEKSSTQLAVFV